MARAAAAGLSALVLGVFLAACSGPDLEGLEKGEAGTVAQVVDGDTLVLESGLRVTLVEVEAPFGEAPFASEARAGLERATLHRRVRLAYGGLKRYAPRAPASGEAKAKDKGDARSPPTETALAHVFVRSEGGRWIWVQEGLVAQGLVRVRTRQENRARAAALLAAEARARAARRGLWALREYRVRNAIALAGEAADLPRSCGRGPLLVVEGRIRQASVSDARAYLNFGGPDEYGSDTTIGVYGDAVAAWRAKGPPFASYQNKQVRVRGRVANRGGPLICVDHPEQIEVLN
ncbi:MAG: thermonuclease family protein [Hydrogenophilaceae bacterium]|nr:thermonuclease family protein [Hydrogenophilaceae bacterium]